MDSFAFSNEKKVMERIDIKSLNLEELTSPVKRTGASGIPGQADLSVGP